MNIAQILLRRKDFNDSKSMLKDVIAKYLELDVVPVINENDVIDLNSFGGNDYLAAEIAIALGAEKLVILSTWERSKFGVGGGESKRMVVSKLQEAGIVSEILDGKVKNVLINSI